MKNLIFILFILFIALIQEAIAQHIKVNGGAGIGFFNLSEYKKLNDDVLAALPVQGQLISNFPGTISPEAAIVYETPFNTLAKIRLSWSFHSTGSRISYTDYSGKYLFDQTITFTTISTEFGFRIFRSNTYDMHLNASLGILRGKHNSHETLDLYSINYINIENNNSFTYLNGTVTSEFIKHFNDFDCGFRIGYNYAFLELSVERDTAPKPHANGLQLSGFIGFKIF